MSHGADHGHKGHEEGHEDENFADKALSFTIQPIEMVKHNPNVFWHNPKHLAGTYEILGGHGFGICAATGAVIAQAYFHA